MVSSSAPHGEWEDEFNRMAQTQFPQPIFLPHEMKPFNVTPPSALSLASA